MNIECSNQINFQLIPEELQLHVLRQLDLKNLLKSCWDVSCKWRVMAEEIAKPRALQLAERLGLPKDAPMRKTCVRVKELARVCGIEAEGKTLEALVEELKMQADEINTEGMKGRLPYFKLLLNKCLEADEIADFNDWSFRDSLPYYLEAMVKNGLNPDQVFLMAEEEEKLYFRSASPFHNWFLDLDCIDDRFLNDPDLKVLLESMIEKVQFKDGDEFGNCLEKLLSLKGKSSDQQKDRLDDVIISLIRAVTEAKERAIKEAEEEGIEKDVESNFQMGRYNNVSALEKKGFKLSDKVLLAMSQAGENIGENNVKELAKKYPLENRIVEQAANIKKTRLKNIIKVVIEVTACAFVLIGGVALAIVNLPALQVFALISIFSIIAIHWLLWGKLII